MLAGERLKIVRLPFLSGAIFEAYVISSLRFSEFQFPIFYTQSAPNSFVEKPNLKFSDLKMRRREVYKRKSSLS